MTDGLIKLGSAFGNQLGFTSDRFEPGSYLWKQGGDIMVSFIASRRPGHGAFRGLVERIHAMGLTVKVPTPLGRMAVDRGKEVAKRDARIAELERPLGARLRAWWRQRKGGTS